MSQRLDRSQDPECDLHSEELGRWVGTGVQLTPCPAGGLLGIHPEPEAWDAIQEQLPENANSEQQGRERNRGTRRTKSSPLIGKLFDDTGDFHSPSHAKSRTGMRLRYYISHRLVRGTRTDHLDAWRLPADELERKLYVAITEHAAKPGVRVCLLAGADSGQITRLGKGLDDLAGRTSYEVRKMPSALQKATIRPGRIDVELDKAQLAHILELPTDRLDEGCLQFEATFQLRRGGVETKLILGGEHRQRDKTLFGNIARGCQVLELVRRGKSHSEIAQLLGLSKSNVQHLIEYAFLAPYIIEDVYDGKQPIGFTSESVKRNKLPSDWGEQSAMIARL